MRRRVLVVDDDIDTAQTLFFLLLDMGHEAGYATDGESALQKARKLRPEFDLLVLDINIPYLSGTQFVATLIADHTLPPVPVVFITGHEDLFHEALAIGKPCLLKPFYVDQLLSLTDRLLSDAR